MRKPPHADVRRNLFAPRSDRLQLLYTLTEGAGDAAANLGRDAVPTAFGPAEILEASGGVESPASRDALLSLWRSDADGPLLSFDDPAAPDRYMRLYTQGEDSASFDRGTLLLHIRLDSTGNGTRPIFNSGRVQSDLADPNSASGAFKAARLGGAASDTIRVQLFNKSHTAINLDVSGLDADARLHTLIVTWGELGFFAFLDTFANGAFNTDHTDGWAMRSNEIFRVLANAGDSGNGFAVPTEFGNMGLSTLALWDTQLTPRELSELLLDPHLPMRPHAGDAFLFKSNPVMTRPTRDDDNPDESTLTFNCVTSGVVGATAHYRVNYRPFAGDANWIVSEIVTRTNTLDYGKIYQAMPLVLTHLLDETEYEWYAEWSEDGETFYPFPAGKGRFRTAPGPDSSFSFAFYTDDHRAGPSEGGINIEDAFGVESPYLRAYANWRGNKDVYDNQSLDFIVDGGDNLFIDADARPGHIEHIDDGRIGDIDGDHFQRIAAWIGQQFLRLKQAPLFLTLGNHEGEAGYIQSSAQSHLWAQQKQCTIARKRSILNPDHLTYASQYGVEMGENEGNEFAPGGNDWIPALDDVDALGTPFDEWYPGRSYRDDFIYDRLGPNGEPAENRSPLGNYFAWRWGSLLCVVLDVLRYSDPGERAESDLAEGTIGSVGNGMGGEHDRVDRPWQFGRAQRQWLVRVLEAAKQTPWKLIFMHHLPGGEMLGIGDGTGDDRNYGRGSGVRMIVDEDGQGADQTWLLRVCQRYGVNAIVKGHDHKFAVVDQGVWIITGPTPSARSHTERDGWNWPGIENSYGTSQSLGSQDADGQPFAEHLKTMFNVLGYIRFDVSPERLRLTLRQTSVTMFPDFATPIHNERWIGPTYKIKDGRINLAKPTPNQAIAYAPEFPALPGEAPTDVTAIVPRNVLQTRDEWWSWIGTLNWYTTRGNEILDEPYANQFIDLPGRGGKVLVAATPRDVVRMKVPPARRQWFDGDAADVASPEIPPTEGDLDGDGCVDAGDLLLLLEAYGASADGDLDGDNRTNLTDLAILLSRFGEGCR